jgi:hypothetical protein
MQFHRLRRAHWAFWFGGGPKGPPSAPPAIPPIIINPFSYQTPAPAIDPRITPLGPPVTPVYRPDIRFADLALA